MPHPTALSAWNLPDLPVNKDNAKLSNQNRTQAKKTSYFISLLMKMTPGMITCGRRGADGLNHLTPAQLRRGGGGVGQAVMHTG